MAPKITLLVAMMVTVICGAALWFADDVRQSNRTPRQGNPDSRTHAEIVSIRERREFISGGSNGLAFDMYRFYPMIRFVTLSGMRVEAESRCYYDHRRRQPNDRVVVFYDRSDPADVCVADGIDPSREDVVDKALDITVGWAAFTLLIVALCLGIYTLAVLHLGRHPT